MVQRPTIPYFKGLVVDNIILGGQGCGSLKRLPQPFFLKITLFKKDGSSKPLMTSRPSSSGIFMPIIRAFKWVIICFRTIIGSHLIWRKGNWCLKCIIAINRHCISLSIMIPFKVVDYIKIWKEKLDWLQKWHIRFWKKLGKNSSKNEKTNYSSPGV